MRTITSPPPRKTRDRLTAAIISLAMLAPLAACSTGNPDPRAASSSPGPASAVGTRMVADADLPEYVVNGDFSYPGSPWGRNVAWNIWPDTGQYASVDTSSPAGRIDGWDAKRFGWTSTQTVGHAGVVELQNRSATGNIYVELAAYEPNTSIYQDIRTTPGTMLVWRLRHTSLTRDYLDRMSVMIGAPGHETAQQATRVSVNGLGDKTGPVGTVIATPSGVDTWAGTRTRGGRRTPANTSCPPARPSPGSNSSTWAREAARKATCSTTSSSAASTRSITTATETPGVPLRNRNNRKQQKNEKTTYLRYDSHDLSYHTALPHRHRHG